MKSANKKLGEILLEEELITAKQLKQALGEQEQAGGFLGEILVRMGLIDEEELTTCLVKQCRIPYLKLGSMKVNEKLGTLIPAHVCHAYQVLPVDKLGNLLTVAMVNPLDVEALEQVKAAVPFRIKPIICSWYDFEECFERIFGRLTPDQLAADQAAHPMPGAPAAPPAEARAGDAAARPAERTDATAVARAAEATGAAPALAVEPPLAHLHPDYTFASFVVAEANDFPVSTAHALVDNAGKALNPCTIHGAPGVGKTHLAVAIGHALLEHDPERAVCYTTAGAFAEDVADAVRRRDVPRFRASYRRLHLFILDDAQFLAGREHAQDELVQLCTDLRAQHRQIVLVADAAPKQLTGLDERLAAELDGGTVLVLEAPDYSARLGILEQMVAAAGAELAPAVLDHLAQADIASVHELRGALRTLLAYAALVGQEITEDRAQAVLRHLPMQVAAG